MADEQELVDIQELIESDPERYSNPTSNQFIMELVYNYIPYLISQGTSELQAQLILAEVLSQLYPVKPQTESEISKYYEQTTGMKYIGTPYQLNEVNRILSDDKSFQPKTVFDVKVGGSSLYSQFDAFRSSQYSQSQRAESQELENAALQATSGTYGRELVGLRNYLKQQILDGKITPADAEKRLMTLDYEAALGAQKTQQEAEIGQATLQERIDNQAKANQVLSQQAADERQRQAIQNELEANLLPYPTSEEYDAQFESLTRDITNPAMKRFVQNRQSNIWSTFVSAGGNKALEAWYKTINSPAYVRAQQQWADYTRERSIGVTAESMMTGVNAPYGSNFQTTLTEYGLPSATTAKELATSAATKLNVEESVSLENERLAAQSLANKALSESPWQKYLKEQKASGDWYKEFWSTPKSLRTGGTTQSSIAPSIRQRYG